MIYNVEDPRPQYFEVGSKNMYKVYILKLSSGSYYVGSTNDLDRRMAEHLLGKSYYTKSRLPLTLIYTENYSSRSEAQSREYQIKSWKKRKAIERLINKQKGLI